MAAVVAVTVVAGMRRRGQRRARGIEIELERRVDEPRVEIGVRAFAAAAPLEVAGVLVVRVAQRTR